MPVNLESRCAGRSPLHVCPSVSKEDAVGDTQTGLLDEKRRKPGKCLLTSIIGLGARRRSIMCLFNVPLFTFLWS
jgi:hypothetical protein